MKILVTGGTGCLGAAAADALAARGHRVSGLARSQRSSGVLRGRGIMPVAGDFGDPVSLADAVHETRPDVVVSTASVAGASGDSAAFARDREAVRAMLEAISDHDGALVFTSGSAVFGSFNGGEATDTVYDEDAQLPLPESVFAPASAGVHPLLAAGFGDAMVARVQTEQAVLADGGARGVVLRPGLVYGRGGNSDLRSLIGRARAAGRAGHWGSGGTTQSYVHVEDVAELFCLAAEHAPHGAILHGVTEDVTQRELAIAINHLIGAGEQTECLSPGANAGYQRRHGRRRHIHTAAHRRVRYQLVAEQALVIGKDSQAPRLVTKTRGHLRRPSFRLIRQLDGITKWLPRIRYRCGLGRRLGIPRTRTIPLLGGSLSQ